MTPHLVLLTAFSMAVGWRVRGQFGHEIGAAMAGALGAMALALFSGREDWRRRVHYFALFGALGWAFGGSMSYMKVVGYSHSSDSATVLYGFAGIFLLGFLWAALGGAGAALAAVLESDRLSALFPAIGAVFGAWFLQDVVVDWWRVLPSTGGALGARVAEVGGLARFDADWLQATVAIAAVLVLALVRRRVDLGTSLVLHLAIGWWVAFGGLVLLLGLRLNPPRGDNWAGCVGLVAGLLWFCRRQRLGHLAMAALAAGFLGGVAFCLGQMIKLAFIATGIQWGWHSVMEWFHGLLFGVALTVALTPLLRRGPGLEERALVRGTEIFSVFFVLWVIPYLNFRKSPLLWLKTVKSLPPEVYGIPVVANFAPSKGWIGWFDSVYVLLGAVLLALLIRQSRRPLPAIPESWAGKGQLLYLAFLWSVTFISFAHEVPGFSPQGLAINWAITVNAILCTWLLLAARPLEQAGPPGAAAFAYAGWTRRTLALGLLAALASSASGWGLKRLLYGDRFAGYFYMDHIRFGPKNTNDRR